VASFTFLAHYRESYGAMAVAADDRYVYLATEEKSRAPAGLRVVDTAAGRQTPLAFLPLPFAAVEAILRDDMLYLGSYGRDAHLMLVDVHDPRHPRLRGTVAGQSERLALAGTTLLGIGEFEKSLQIYDVIDPDRPLRIGSAELPEYTLGRGGVAANGASALVVLAEHGQIVTVDFTDPTRPRLIGKPFALRTHGSNAAGGVAMAGAYAFLTEGQRFSALRVAPLPLERRDELSVPSELRGVAARGSRVAFVGRGDNRDGAWLVDASDPDDMKVLADYEGVPRARDVVLTDQRLYVLTENGALFILGLPSLPKPSPRARPSPLPPTSRPPDTATATQMPERSTPTPSQTPSAISTATLLATATPQWLGLVYLPIGLRQPLRVSDGSHWLPAHN
jgi:hypothetical protein